MSPSTVLLQAHVRSLLGALREDGRTRVIAGFVLLFDVLVGIWSARLLGVWMDAWRAAGAGVLESQLWLLAASLCLGSALLSVVETLQHGFASDEASLLFTLPVADSSRFRALFALVIFEGLGNWLVLVAAIFAGALGRTGLAWLVLLLAGFAAAALLGVTSTLLAVRLWSPSQRLRMVAAGLAAAGLGGGGVGLVATLLGPTVAPSPAVVSLLPALVLVAALGPWAGRLGMVYTSAFRSLHGRGGARRAITPPAIGMVARAAMRRRTLAGALLAKELLSQSRNPLNWLRVIAIGAYIVPFSWIRQAIGPEALPGPLWVVGYGMVVIFLTLMEVAPSPIGSEGNRLALYLVAPHRVADFLRAKFAVFGGLVVLEGLALSMVLGRWAGLGPLELAFAAVALTCIVLAMAATLVWGSAWDEDLDLAVEGAVQTMLVEEVPSTPRRLWLLGLTLLVGSSAFLLAWKLPPALAFTVVGAFASVSMAVAWRFGNAYLRRLLR
ncbi:MAG TPA: hypothetical protein VER55_06475 [Ardenticatenaceae bacterium]|nr:hypothetical protein [Ardenticatenaceae bacterium]